MKKMYRKTRRLCSLLILTILLTNVQGVPLSVIQIQANTVSSDVEIFPLKNGDFTQGNAFWEPITTEGGRGSASITGQAQFTIDDTGENPWSVMLIQKDIVFVAGVKYIFSFEASSTIPRDIVVKTEEEGTWIEFFNQTITLTSKKQRYSFEYTMPSGADMNLGLKFLLGAMNNSPDGTHTIAIDNVMCEVKDGKFLKSEVKNGRFDKGLESWNTYIAADKGAAGHISADDKVLKIGIDELGQNPWEVQVSQKGIRFEKGKTYHVGFKVKGDSATKFKLSIGGEDDNYNFTNYLGEDKIFNMTHIEESHDFSFTMTNDTDTNAKISFDAGKIDDRSATTTLYIDDVYIVEGSASKEESIEENKNEIVVLALDFNRHEEDRMEKADGWTNGGMFDCTWRTDNVTFENGSMFLKIGQDGGNGQSKWSGGEYRTWERFSYGRYEIRMKPIKNNGVVSSFFTYIGPTDNEPWDEIDIEFLGKDTTKVQYNYFTNGVGNHEYVHDLGFDAAEAFHDYGFEWRKDSITWYVDGIEVYKATDNIPQTPGKVMMNTWPGVGVDSWLNVFDGTVPLRAEYDWMRITQYDVD